ncbi:hypothetical protein BPOR_0244g00090 [Botrytis porri]|uniref:Uncharacterized protein n=1 Tax=Botrytis porri TaxID=87229 RepID=A0A4Z1KRQ8_9HELO|nr:hypothetical protein BPOR_0244g00090 [Botrytis porri]
MWLFCELSSFGSQIQDDNMQQYPAESHRQPPEVTSLIKVDGLTLQNSAFHTLAIILHSAVSLLSGKLAESQGVTLHTKMDHAMRGTLLPKSIQ